MKTYNVNQAFELLKEYKITTHKESVRRWLRIGTLKGEAPLCRKEGWKISEKDLWDFIHARLPEKIHSFSKPNTTNVLLDEQKESIRAEMWWEIVNQNVFADFIEIKKSRLRECINHNRQSTKFAEYVWSDIKSKSWYAQPRIPYLLDAFLYDGKRIKFDESYESLEEKIIFPLIEYIRVEYIQEHKKDK